MHHPSLTWFRRKPKPLEGLSAKVAALFQHGTIGGKKLLRSTLMALFRRVRDVTEQFAERDLPEFATRPRNLTINLPRRIHGSDRMHIGDDVTLGPGSLLVALDAYPSPQMQDRRRASTGQSFESRIVIGNRVTATGGLTLAAHQEIVIEDDVLLASNINMTDGLHGYTHANEPYKYQPIFRITPIRVCRGSWIGQNVMVMPGVTIGELAIIGANSVVTHDIPPRCIALGAPARVTKRWNDAAQRWDAVPADTATDGAAEASRLAAAYRAATAPAAETRPNGAGVS